MTLDAPTELAAGADALTSFAAAALAARSGVRRVPAGEVAAAVVEALVSHGAHSLALVPDLGVHLEPVREACVAAGLETRDYAGLDRGRLAALDAAVTGCAAALAPTGSILTTAAVGRGAALVPPLHVCVVGAHQVLSGLRELLRALPGLGVGSLSALQTGPSRTADIEKVLVIGAHGPRAVEIVLVEPQGG